MKVHPEDRSEATHRVFPDGSWRLFDELSRAICEMFGGAWAEKLDGFDQRYWDFQVGDAVVTLHLDHYLGISIFPSESASDRQASIELARQISEFAGLNTPTV